MQKLKLFVAFLLLALTVENANAFWLLNFQTAPTMTPGSAGFIGGTGGQYTSVGSPSTSSFTPFLAHAGIRYGLTGNLDVGYRLCTVPLPYSSAGPSLGGEVDFKLALSPKTSGWQTSLIAGVGYSYLVVSDQTKDAWSPGADLILTHSLANHVDLSWNARYVYTGISSAAGGDKNNHVQVAGGSMGAKFPLSTNVAIQPEVGAFDFIGTLAGKSLNGWGFQYGVVLSTKIN